MLHEFCGYEGYTPYAQDAFNAIIAEMRAGLSRKWLKMVLIPLNGFGQANTVFLNGPDRQ
jgi:hypothetical protein